MNNKLRFDEDSSSKGENPSDIQSENEFFFIPPFNINCFDNHVSEDIG